MSDPALWRGRHGTEDLGGTAFLIHATWVGEDVWFWECPECDCAFGPLVSHDAAAQQAREHDALEQHSAVSR